MTLGWSMVLVVGLQDDVRKELQEMRRLLEVQSARITELEARLGERRAEPVPAPAAPESYSTNFLDRFDTLGAHVGGYVDLEFIDRERNRSESTLDPHRLVLLLAAAPSEHVKFWSEIEIEHGGEVGVEFSHVDLLITEAFNLRGGIILEPLGRFNLEHDAPLNDLTLRPLVDRNVIPAVLRDAGIGAFGRWEWGQTLWSYEGYVTNGFEVLDRDGSLSSTNPRNVLRSGRPSEADGFEGAYDDFNNDKAFVGRLGFSPALGVDLGLSGYRGDYDARGDNALGIYAADLKLQGGALANAFDAGGGFREFLFAHEWLVEFAQADFARDRFASASGVPREMTGFYAQWNYHFMPQFLRDALGDWATEETTFTLVARYDDVHVGVGSLDPHDRKMTFGLNFRPTEATVIKFDYEIDVDEADEGVAASIATYF